MGADMTLSGASAQEIIIITTCMTTDIVSTPDLKKILCHAFIELLLLVNY
jgi:hypothetical protein